MDPELFKRMQEAAARFKSGESDFEEIITPAGPAHLVRDPSDPRGFRIDFVGDGAKRSVPVQRYPASPSRPPGYPAPLPFLADCDATVNTLDQAVVWVDPPGGLGAAHGVLQQCLDDGWTPLDISVSGEQDDEVVGVLDKEGATRTLRATDDGIVRLELTEHRGPAKDG